MATRIQLRHAFALPFSSSWSLTDSTAFYQRSYKIISIGLSIVDGTINPEAMTIKNSLKRKRYSGKDFVESFRVYQFGPAVIGLSMRDAGNLIVMNRNI